ncbi:hypothetical protein NM208_g9490 [Fusarium decemcellulare]|uniref:Uncharacterized protein n=1 Tax=Fusarium decemcellulare TaxID=57161 RepID=A0ACC1S1C6_9HYPO|nr:hypothetical protein NM208_g9490 [Fusarium decemcellulare]
MHLQEQRPFGVFEKVSRPNKVIVEVYVRIVATQRVYDGGSVDLSRLPQTYSVHFHPPFFAAMPFHTEDNMSSHQPQSSSQNRPLERSTSTEHTPLIHRRDVEIDRTSAPDIDYNNALMMAVADAWHTSKLVMLSTGQMGWNSSAVFVLNFIAIVPLVAMLSFCPEKLADRVGDVWGSLINATLGKSVEFIVSIVALKQDQIEIVQSSMLGSILSNLLLVLSLCFILGGTWNMTDGAGNGSEQTFTSTTGQTTSTLMTLSSASMIIPAAVSTSRLA